MRGRILHNATKVAVAPWKQMKEALDLERTLSGGYIEACFLFLDSVESQTEHHLFLAPLQGHDRFKVCMLVSGGMSPVPAHIWSAQSSPLVKLSFCPSAILTSRKLCRPAFLSGITIPFHFFPSPSFISFCFPRNTEPEDTVGII